MPDSEKMTSHFMALLYYVVPPCLIALGLYYSYLSIVFVMQGEKATARVTRIEKTTEMVDGDRRSKTDWHISYQTADGTQQRGTVSAGLFSLVKVGDEIEVLYDPKKPGNVKVNSFFSLWGIPIMFGIPVLLVLGYLMRRRFKERTVKYSGQHAPNADN